MINYQVIYIEDKKIDVSVSWNRFFKSIQRWSVKYLSEDVFAHVHILGISNKMAYFKMYLNI